MVKYRRKYKISSQYRFNRMNVFNNNAQLEADLEKLPTEVGEALLEWRKQTLEREKQEALLYLKFKNDADGEKRTVTEIEALVESSEERYNSRLIEALAEAAYHKKLETLLCAKKMADLRTAF